MSRFSFKGHVESVRPSQLDYICSVLENRGFKAAEVSIEPLGKAGDNYMSNVMKIDVSENGKNLHIVAKIAPDSHVMRQMGNLAQVFKNEHIIYSKLFPKFRELQKSAGVSKEELFNFPKHYGSNLDEPHEIILLENLNKKNFAMQDRMKPLPIECLKMSLKQLAIYHSLSYVLKVQEPETFAALSAELGDLFKETFADSPEIKMAFTKMEEVAISLTSDDKYKKNIKGTTSEISQHYTKLKRDDSPKRSVIQQGDGWTNNILFKHEGDKLVDCTLIDYQNAIENSPIYDIMYMLFNSTSHEQRLKHYNELIDYYHKELDDALNNFNLKASLIYPRDQLDADLKRYGKLMLSITIMVSNFLIRNVQEATEVQEAMKNTTMENSQEVLDSMMIKDGDTLVLYRSKIEGLVDSFIEFGLI